MAESESTKRARTMEDGKITSTLSHQESSKLPLFYKDDAISTSEGQSWLLAVDKSPNAENAFQWLLKNVNTAKDRVVIMIVVEKVSPTCYFSNRSVLTLSLKINYSRDHTAAFFQKVETEFNEVLNKSADEHLQQLKKRAEDSGVCLQAASV